MYKNRDIEAKRTISSWQKEAKNKTKREKCMYCGREVTSFCNSHSIPRFILKRISQDGWLYTPNKQVENPLLDEEKGLNKSGTFNNICKQCDSEIFSEYESEEKLQSDITNKMMAQIAIKDILHDLYVKELNLNMLKVPKSKMNIGLELMEKIYIKPLELDVEELKRNFRVPKKIIDKNLKSGYKLMFDKKLDYIVPIASQGEICIFSDLNGKVLNNIYNKDERAKLQYIHLCVFPLESSTRIIMFYHKNNNSYFGFERQFNRLSEKEKLELTNFLILNETENFFIFKNVNEELVNNEKIKEVVRNTGTLISPTKEDIAERVNQIKKFREIPNFLDEKYKIDSYNQEQ